MPSQSVNWKCVTVWVFASAVSVAPTPSASGMSLCELPVLLNSVNVSPFRFSTSVVDHGAFVVMRIHSDWARRPALGGLLPE